MGVNPVRCIAEKDYVGFLFTQFVVSLATREIPLVNFGQMESSSESPCGFFGVVVTMLVELQNGAATMEGT